MSNEVENEKLNQEDESIKKKRKRYAVCGKILLITGIILILVGFIGFIESSMEFVEDFFEDDDMVSPSIFVIPFVIGMFCLAGGAVLSGLGHPGGIKHRNLQAHTIIINEATPTENIEEPKQEKKGGKCQNCGAPYKADEKTCKYCGSDL